MDAQFCVGYSGKMEDLKSIVQSASKVKTVYAGGLVRKIGAGRPRFMESWDQLAPQVAYARENGLRFEVALNAPGGIPHIDDESWWADTIDYLQQLESLGVNGVIVAHPLLMRGVKRHTNLRLTVSTICDVMTARGARYFEEMGADVIVPSMNVNLDLPKLREMAKALRTAKLRLMLNERCMGDCVFRRFHFDYYSGVDENKDTRDDPYYLNCHTLYYRKPYMLLANTTIRPEDLHYYKEITDQFKIVGRLASLEDQLARIQAYEQESFEGNYIQLILSQFTSMIHMPNKALDDLILKKWACDKICEPCGHCQELFEKHGEIIH